jgi:hypothetical protein
VKLFELFDLKQTNKPKTSDHSYEIEQEVGGRTITFIAMKQDFTDNENHWRIDFAEHLDADVDEPFVNYKTGKGKEFEVFSFVVACAKKFVADKNPNVIELRSDKTESNRAKLYAHLAKKFGAGYTITHKENGHYDITVMTKRT